MLRLKKIRPWLDSIYSERDTAALFLNLDGGVKQVIGSDYDQVLHQGRFHEEKKKFLYAPWSGVDLAWHLFGKLYSDRKFGRLISYFLTNVGIYLRKKGAERYDSASGQKDLERINLETRLIKDFADNALKGLPISMIREVCRDKVMEYVCPGAKKVTEILTSRNAFYLVSKALGDVLETFKEYVGTNFGYIGNELRVEEGIIRGLDEESAIFTSEQKHNAFAMISEGYDRLLALGHRKDDFPGELEGVDVVRVALKVGSNRVSEEVMDQADIIIRGRDLWNFGFFLCEHLENSEKRL